MLNLLRIHPSDNVAVALLPLSAGAAVTAGDISVCLTEDIPAGHKLALEDIPAGAAVRKYGHPIGNASADIPAGSWVHTHNLRTGLSQTDAYAYHPVNCRPEPRGPLMFQGYQRPDGRVGIRNELWIIPTVGCVNDICKALVRENEGLAAEFGLDGLYTFPHPYGCSQLGEDHAATRKLLSALCRHPNAGGVLVVGLGCENNRMEDFKALFSDLHLTKLRFLTCQEVEDELAAGADLLRDLARYAGEARRGPVSAAKLVVGMKCGGSDGLSGITANPVVGAFSDLLTAMGGSTVLTEVPEMFGAEDLLLDRCRDEETFQKAVGMIGGFKDYFTAQGQPVYENPSPGNKDGGITTLEDKSLGCVQKGGFAPVEDVLGYGDAVTRPGLNLLYGPGNDLVSATALTAAGADLILFTTGRGTPFGAPAPTLKISTNSALHAHKGHWLDFNAGTVAEGERVEAAAHRLLALVLSVASGETQTKSERHNCRDIAIWKNGVTL